MLLLSHRQRTGEQFKSGFPLILGPLQKRYATQSPFDVNGGLGSICIAWLDTNLKSGRGIYDSHKLQLAAYAHAFAEMTGRYPDAGFVLHTNAEKGKYRANCG